MAIPWLTVLQSVPWTDVIRNAPKVADGARKLWQRVARRTPAAGAASPAGASLVPADDAVRLAALEAAVADLHEQMLASSDLIRALAEQNTQLIGRLETQERRLHRLGRAAAAGALVLLLGLAALALRVLG